MTHNVLKKELEYCRHIEDLEMTEGVKKKAKDYMRAYMTRHGAVYRKHKDEKRRTDGGGERENDDGQDEVDEAQEDDEDAANPPPQYGDEVGVQAEGSTWR